MNQREEAILFMERGPLARARDLLIEWVLQEPTDIYAHALLTHCFRVAGNPRTSWEECKSFYENTYRAENGARLLHFVEAERLFSSNQKDRSAKKFEAAIKAGLDDPIVHCRLGDTFSVVGETKKAMDAYRKSLEQDTTFLPALKGYVLLLFKEGLFCRIPPLMKSIYGQMEDDSCCTYFGETKAISEIQEIGEATNTLRIAIMKAHRGHSHEASRFLWDTFRLYKQNCWMARTMVILFLSLKCPKADAVASQGGL